MNRTEIIDAIVETLKAELKEVEGSVIPYDGRFTGKEIKESSFKTPTIFVDCLGGELKSWPYPYEKTVDEDGLFELLIIGKSIMRSRSQVRADKTAAAIIDRLKNFIPLQSWGLDVEFLMTPRLTDVQNAVTFKLNRQGVSFQSIRFQQAWRDGPQIPYSIEERS